MTDQQIKDTGSPHPCFWYFYACLLKFGDINVGLGWTGSSYIYIYIYRTWEGDSDVIEEKQRTDEQIY